MKKKKRPLWLQLILLPATVLKILMLGLLRFYKTFVSPLLPPACRFHPTCSVYFMQALEKKGVVKGTLMGLWRLLRCNPFSAGGHDPVDPEDHPGEALVASFMEEDEFCQKKDSKKG